MDAVLTDPSAAHHDIVARSDPLLVARLAVYEGRHNTACPAIDEGFAQKAVVEYEGAVDSRNAALVAAVLDAFPYAVKDPSGDGGALAGWDP